MRILNRLKWKLTGGPSTEELSEIPLMNEKWICPFFKFPFPDWKFSQLSKLCPVENPTREEVVIGFILPALGELERIKRPGCSVNKKAVPRTVSLVFPDRSQGDLPNASEYEYRLSPIETVRYLDCFRSIEGVLITLFGLKRFRTKKGMLEFYFGDLDVTEEPTEKETRKKPLMVEYTDNLCYFTYPLEKRVELFSEYEEAEKWLSENLLGENFEKFIDFIMETERAHRYMKIYCSETRKLLEKYNIH